MFGRVAAPRSPCAMPLSRPLDVCTLDFVLALGICHWWLRRFHDDFIQNPEDSGLYPLRHLRLVILSVVSIRRWIEHSEFDVGSDLEGTITQVRNIDNVNRRGHGTPYGSVI